MKINTIIEKTTLSSHLTMYAKNDHDYIKHINRVDKKISTKKLMHNLQLYKSSCISNFLAIYKSCYFYQYTSNFSEEKVEAIDELIINAQLHQKFLKYIDTEKWDMYATVVMVMKRKKSLARLYDLDIFKFCATLNKITNSSKNIIDQWLYELVSFVPYLESNYFIHTLKNNSMWRKWCNDDLYSSLVKAGGDSDELVAKFCKKKIYQHKFLHIMCVKKIVYVMKLYDENDKVIELLDLIGDNDSAILYHISEMEINQIMDCSSFILLLKSAIPLLKGIKFRELIAFSFQTDYDLKILRKLIPKIETMEAKEQKELFKLPPYFIIAQIYENENVLSIANKCWYKKYSELPKLSFSYNTIQKSVCMLMYAIINQKKHFISLIVNNEIGANELEYFIEIDKGIFKYLNINELNAKQIKKVVENRMLHWSESSKSSLADKRYNFSEISILEDIFARSDSEYLVAIFNSLLENIKSDDACIRMKQYLRVRKTLIVKDFVQKDIAPIVEALVLLDLPGWKREIFNFKASLTLVAECLPHLLELRDVLPEATNDVEVRFILSNIELCKKGLKKAMRQYVKVDQNVKRLKSLMELDDTFYNKFKQESMCFFVSGYATMANTYYRHLEYKSKALAEKFKLVIKAALSNNLDRLRYTDLEKECSMQLPNSVSSIWFENQKIEANLANVGSVICYEDTSFNGIMSMGTKPTSTCMSYIDGSYVQCLLSYFDGNKKIVYVKKNSGEIVARAVIRLTKMTFEENATTKLRFTDVSESNSGETKEYIVVFLERMYSGYQGSANRELEKLLIAFISKKAKSAGITEVISSDYYVLSSGENKEYDLKGMGIYITKSKAGTQYLDSFGGAVNCKNSTKLEEDTYIYSKCYIKA